jgi:hypothetical protein
LFIQCEGVCGEVLRRNEDIVTKQFVNMELINKPLQRKTKKKMEKA